MMRMFHPGFPNINHERVPPVFTPQIPDRIGMKHRQRDQ